MGSNYLDPKEKYFIEHSGTHYDHVKGPNGEKFLREKSTGKIYSSNGKTQQEFDSNGNLRNKN